MDGPSMGRLALNDMKTRPSHGDQPGPVNTGWGRPSCRAAAASITAPLQQQVAAHSEFDLLAQLVILASAPYGA
jgi:hypothetical protein